MTTLERLNEQAQAFCLGEAAQRKHPEDRSWTVQAAWQAERPRLLPLPAVPFPTQEIVTVHAGKTPYVISGPGEYEVKGITFKGVESKFTWFEGKTAIQKINT